MDARPRIVLDTNVCLDLFVFDDPRVARLRESLHHRTLLAMTDAACRAEWLRVLDYPAMALAAARRESALREFDATMTLLTTAPYASAAESPGLPRCRDPDDQKFLELASRSGARWLLTRDDHLLALARRTRRDGLFEIMTPQAWADAFFASPAAQ